MRSEEDKDEDYEGDDVAADAQAIRSDDSLWATTQPLHYEDDSSRSR